MPWNPKSALVSVALLVACASSVQAQSSGSATTSMKSLLEHGFEIKAAAPNGDKYVVFLQREREAYACEFVTLSVSRCGAMNKEAN